MKLLVLSEISGFNPSLVRKNINSVLESENIDVVILLGGLFKSKAKKTEKSANSQLVIKEKRKKKEMESLNEANTILSLNWLGKPVIVVPSLSDLANKKLIKQIKGQDTIYIRYLFNSSTLIDDWLFLAITHDLNKEEDQTRQMIQNYLRFNDENILILNCGDQLNFLKSSKLNLISREAAKNDNPDSFVIKVDSKKENGTKIVDLTNKTFSSFIFE